VLVHVFKNGETVRLFVLDGDKTPEDLYSELGDVDGTGQYVLIVRGRGEPLLRDKPVRIASMIIPGESTLSLDVISVAQVEMQQQQQQQPSTTVAAAGRRGRVRRASCRGGGGGGSGLVAFVVLLLIVAAGVAFGVRHSRRRLRGAGRSGRR
jgi:hypothetical protein